LLLFPGEEPTGNHENRAAEPPPRVPGRLDSVVYFLEGPKAVKNREPIPDLRQSDHQL
jgi:hypothetical protein